MSYCGLTFFIFEQRGQMFSVEWLRLDFYELTLSILEDFQEQIPQKRTSELCFAVVSINQCTTLRTELQHFTILLQKHVPVPR